MRRDSIAGGKTRFHALYAVMLDDVGGKVAMDRLTLPPSWLAGNLPGQPSGGLSAARTAGGRQCG